MKIAIYGATGMVGTDILIEATGRGHAVTGLSRTGGQRVHALDLGETEAFKKIASENPVVVIAVPPDRTGGSHMPFLTAVDGVVHSGTGSRVVMVVGAGSLVVNGVPLSRRPGYPKAFIPEATTLAAVAQRFQHAPDSLDWTLVSPAPVIEPGERTGFYTVGRDSPAGERVSTQDFAVAILDEIEKPRHRRQRFTVAGH